MQDGKSVVYKEDEIMNERMQVLKMIEDGKVTVDEGAKLLEALHATGGQPGATFEEKFKDFSCEMKKFAKNVTKKVDELAKKAEPKVKDFAKTVVAKTAKLADNISIKLDEAVKKMENCGCECDCECTCECSCDCTCECECTCECDCDCTCECEDANEECGCCDDEAPADNGPRPTD